MSAVSIHTVAVQLSSSDNVAVAAQALSAGLEIDLAGRVIRLSDRVGLGHKFAIKEIRAGQPVYKYGQIIGFASKDIPLGAHVHVHNVSADSFERDYAFC